MSDRPDSGSPEDVLETLERLVERCEGAIGCAVVGLDESTLAFHAIDVDEVVDLETVGSELSFVVGQMRKAAEILEAGDLREVTVHTARLSLVVKMLPEDAFAVLVLTPAGNVGKGRYLLRMAADSLGPAR